MIVVTGANGFIAGSLVRRLRQQGEDLVLFDCKGNDGVIHPQLWSSWWEAHKDEIDGVYHLGAVTDTTIKDSKLFQSYNTNFSKIVWLSCVSDRVPLIYASSAAVYGDGSSGFSDDDSLIGSYRTLNPYAESKLVFDKFVLESKKSPPFWAGLRFFNVYGFNESHKGRMASMAYHMYNQIREEGIVKLFKGDYKRDFIYVDDVIDVMLQIMNNNCPSGIFNLGTGRARSFEELANSMFYSLGRDTKIEYISMPDDLKNQYQTFTQADITKLRDAAYINRSFSPIEQGCMNYTQKLICNENSNITLQSKTER